jgi:hypothetical protein
MLRAKGGAGKFRTRRSLFVRSSAVLGEHLRFCEEWVSTSPVM